MPASVFASVFGTTSVLGPSLKPSRVEARQVQRDEQTDDTTNTALLNLSKILGNNPVLGTALQRAWSRNFDQRDAYELLDQTVRRFTKVQAAVRSHFRRESEYKVVESDLHAIFINSLPPKRLEDAISYSLFLMACALFRLEDPRNARRLVTDRPPIDQTMFAGANLETLYARLNDLVKALRSVGLAGPVLQRSYARAVDAFIDRYVEVNYGDYDGPTPGGRDQGSWDLDMEVKMFLCPFLKKFASPVDELRETFEHLDVLEVEDEGLQQWGDLATDKLGKIRAGQMFDIIAGGEDMDWALDDLRSWTETPAARRILYRGLRDQLHSRLLHPGSSTVEVLDFFMLAINAFQNFDPSGVLLHRIAEPIRGFLRRRDDTVKIIILSLLDKSSGDEDADQKSRPNFCASIAELMQDQGIDRYRPYYEGIDLTSLAWRPEPVDAGFGHRGSEHLDKMAHIVMLESKETFIRELQAVLSERLLQSQDFDFHHELRLLSVFKARFEELQIQQCEVMLRDVVESQRLHESLPTATREEMHARVLSSYYWPALRQDLFRLPAKMELMAARYAEEFVKLKAGRRLEWLKSHGLVSVSLELRDRTVYADVTTWQASVIDVFGEDGGSTASQPLDVAALVARLDMPEDLVRNALDYWTARQVLAADSHGNYTVLETLPSTSFSPSSSAGGGVGVTSGGQRSPTSTSPTTSTATLATAVAAATPLHTQTQTQTQTSVPTNHPSTIKSASETLAESGAVYGSFILSMLTNQGAMPAARMLVMLRMVVAGGFPFELDDLVGFLERMERDDGTVERAGGVWRVKR